MGHLLRVVEGVGARPRRTPPLPAVGDGELGLELDVWVPSGRLRDVDRVLRHEGLHRLRARGQGDHHFWVEHHEGRWTKVDGRTDPPARRLAWADRIARRVPPSWRRSGVVVALLGPDGAGKSTLVRRLAEELPVATTVVYLGSRPRRGGGASSGQLAGRPRRAGWRRVLREPVYVVVKLGRQAPALWRALRLSWQGHVVLCDRHPLDALVVDGRETTFGRRVERVLVRWLVPRPDRILLVTAPPAEMYRRKGEHDVGRLAAWLEAYERVLVPLGAVVIDNGGDPQAAAREASSAVWEALGQQRRWSA